MNEGRVDTYALVKVGRSGTGLIGRLVEHEGELILFTRNQEHTRRWAFADIHRKGRNATTLDGEKVRWVPKCASCSAPTRLRGTRQALLAELGL